MGALRAYREQQKHKHVWTDLSSAVEQCTCGALRMKVERFDQCLPG